VGWVLLEAKRRRLAAKGAKLGRAFAFDRSQSMRKDCGAL